MHCAAPRSALAIKNEGYSVVVLFPISLPNPSTAERPDDPAANVHTEETLLHQQTAHFAIGAAWPLHL